MALLVSPFLYYIVLLCDIQMTVARQLHLLALTLRPLLLLLL
jgi:hypothetical protein